MRWKTVKFGEVSRLINGKAFKQNDWSDIGLPIIRIQNLNDLEKGFNYWNGPLDRQVKVKNGDVLLAWSGTPGTSFGAHLWNGSDAVLNQHIFLVELDLARISKAWAVCAVNHQLIKLISQAQGGVGLQHVTKPMVENLEIPLPPLDEQKRIAEVLDKAEALRQKRRLALQKLDTLLQSVFLDMFGDPITNSSKFDLVPLGRCADLLTGYAFKSSQYVVDNTQTKLCRGANVLPGRIDWSDVAYWNTSDSEGLERFRLSEGDIVIAMDRPWISTGFKIATISKADLPSLLVQRVTRVRAKEPFSNEYLLQLLKHEAFVRHCKPTETTIPHISPLEIANYRVPKAPQDQIAKFSRIVNQLRGARGSYSVFSKSSELLFASIQQRAFQGQLFGVSNGDGQ